MRKVKTFLNSATILSSVILPNVLHATEKLPPPTTGLGGTLKDFIDLLITILQAVGLPFLVIFMIYSGYLLVTAGDNEEQVRKSKTRIMWTIVGAAIILGAQVIADLVFETAEIFY